MHKSQIKIFLCKRTILHQSEVTNDISIIILSTIYRRPVCLVVDWNLNDGFHDSFSLIVAVIMRGIAGAWQNITFVAVCIYVYVLIRCSLNENKIDWLNSTFSGVVCATYGGNVREMFYFSRFAYFWFSSLFNAYNHFC